MTFKHTKFEDSVIMRSLERVAKEKGLVKNDPIQKTASAQLDLTPSGSLMENILNLCAGLRAAGFERFANELEVNYVAYKQASNLYTEDEKAGEKLIDMAHPDGSHKMEGVAGDAVIETILDNHLKMVTVVNKAPTGKLSTASSVINAVRVALGQDVSQRDALEQDIDAALGEALRRWNAIDNIVRREGGLTHLIGRGTDYSVQSSYIKDLLVERPATLDKLKSLKSRIGSALAIIKPGVSIMGGSLNPWGGVSEDVYSTVTPIIQSLNAFVDKAYQARMKINAITTREITNDQGTAEPAEGGRVGVTTRTNPVAEALSSQIEKYKANLDAWTSELRIKKDLNPTEKATAAKWLQDQKAEFDQVANAFASVPDSEKQTSFAKFKARLEQMGSENAQFYKEWIQ